MRTSLLLGLLSLCISFTGTGCPAIAQDADPVGGVRAHIVGIEIPPIANAPFTARVLVTWNEPLVGGGTISRKYYTEVARDSQGRVRRETRGFIPADSTAEPPLHTFTIMDPVLSTRTTCTKATMNCATSPYEPRVNLSEDGGALAGAGSNVTREKLGRQTMNDLPVVGTRATVTSQNTSRVAVTHTDAWYSTDLQMNLSVERVSPQMGDVTLKVTQLVRGEPDRSWFAIPSGYRVIGARSQ